MQKRGQVTVFIILGVLILGLIIGFFFLRNNSVIEELKVEDKTIETTFIKMFVENCLEKSLIESIKHVFSNGGYYNYPINKKLLQFTNEDEKLSVPYYFIDDDVNIPSLNTIEDETAKATKDYVKMCVDDFNSFPQHEITLEEPKVEVKFTKNRIKGNIFWPITISTKEEITTELADIQKEIEEFTISIPLNFIEKYNDIFSFLKMQSETPQEMRIGDLSTLSYQKDYEFRVKQNHENEGDAIIDLHFSDFLEPLTFSFGMNYDWILPEAHLQEPQEIPLIVIFNNTWDINTSGMWEKEIITIGEGLIFSIDSTDLEINLITGKLKVNTENFENDEYLYYIKVEDNKGQSVMTPIYLNINVNLDNYPIIREIEDQITKSGEEYEYNVEIENNNTELILFTTTTDLFEINKQTGKISFTPTELDKGIHSVRVNAENEYGKTWQRWELKIE
jgi:hypothetical protein